MKESKKISITLLAAGLWIAAGIVNAGMSKNVKVTNVRDTQFTVSWLTSKPTTCQIMYGTNTLLGSIAYDDRGSWTVSCTHHVTIKGLLPETRYYCRIVSGEDADEHEPIIVTTGPSIIPVGSDLVYGRVYKSGGREYAKGAIVYITLQDYDGRGSTGDSAPVSVLVDENGYWYTELVNFRTQDLKALFKYSAAGDIIYLQAKGPGEEFDELKVDTGENSPLPDLVLR